MSSQVHVWAHFACIFTVFRDSQAKMFQDSFKMPPRCLQDAPRCPNIAPRCPQDASKMSPNAPKMPPRCYSGASEASGVRSKQILPHTKRCTHIYPNVHRLTWYKEEPLSTSATHYILRASRSFAKTGFMSEGFRLQDAPRCPQDAQHSSKKPPSWPHVASSWQHSPNIAQHSANIAQHSPNIAPT